jgi:enoyl-CoA hydratase/carnithine racemase
MLAIERSGAIVTATLSRPPVNALDGELVGALEALVAQTIDDPAIAVLHLRSSVKAFCAGADLALMRAAFASPDATESMIALVRRMQRLFERIEAAPLVTLAELGGAALGGGLELALACDLRVAAADAKLGLTEASLGLLPGAGGTQRLTRLCGRGIANRLILGAEVIDGAEAERLGLVQWAVPRAELPDRARVLAQRFADVPRPATAAAKRCIAAALTADGRGFAAEIDGTRTLYAHAETRARVAAFLDRSATRATKEGAPDEVR